MIEIEKTPYGFSITLKDLLTESDLAQWRTQSERLLSTSSLEIKVLIDVTSLEPIPMGLKAPYRDLMKLFIEHGMVRSCVIYKSYSVYLQLRNIMSRLPYTGERYINTLQVSGHKRLSREWLVFEKEPVS